MPDALSKTIPIWCAVLNRLLFDDQQNCELCTPTDAVSRSEHAQIEDRITSFVKEADVRSQTIQILWNTKHHVQILRLDIIRLRESLGRPLRPHWVTPEATNGDLPNDRTSYNSIICCTASRRVRGAETSEMGYIQGAGDDSEGWSCGLTPALFWKHHQTLLSIEERECEYFIQSIAREEDARQSASEEVLCIGSSGIFISANNVAVDDRSYDAVILIGGTHLHDSHNDQMTAPARLQLHIASGKLGSRALRKELPRIISFVRPLFLNYLGQPRICILGADTQDLSIGIALAIFSLFYDDGARMLSTARAPGSIGKMDIKRRLAYISSSCPSANPSRTTLQSVHSFLMPRESSAWDTVSG